VLLNYFGQTVTQDCDLCDVCDNPRQKFDGTELVLKALSAIVRTKQSFGMGYIVDILVGSHNQRLLANEHDRLPTFGIGKDQTRDNWFVFLKDMVNLGLLQIAYEDFRKLKLTPLAMEVLQKGAKVELFTPGSASSKPNKTTSTKTKRGAKSDRINDLDEDSSRLFEELREYRKQVARRTEVPPFVIFSDATLLNMVEDRPTNKEEFSQLSGVGAHKLELYWDGFTHIINEFE